MYKPQTTGGHEIRLTLSAYFQYQIIVCGDLDDKTFGRKIITRLDFTSCKEHLNTNTVRTKKNLRERFMKHGD